MGFWGLGENGRDARNKFDEINRWMFERGKNQFDRADQQFGFGDYFQKYLADRYGEMSRGSFGSGAEMNNLGREQMPWVDQLLSDIRGRTAGLGDINDTIGNRSRILDDFGGNITRNYDALDADINNLRGRSEGREDNYHNDIISNILGKYDALGKNSRDTYGRLTGEANTAFDNSIRDVAPNSEARAAASSRAFAPNIASTMLRLRRAGIDPASSEANAMLSNVEAQRARAQEDSFANAIGERNNLRIGKFNTMAELGLGSLRNEQGLGLSELGDVTGEKLRSLGARQGMDRDFTGMSMDNRENAFNRGQDYNMLRYDDQAWNRGAREADINFRNGQDMLGHDLNTQRYNAGVDARGRDVDYNNMGLQNLFNLMNGAYGQGNTQDAYGSSNMRTTQQGFNDQYNREQAGAGWGTKLLSGLGMAAAGAAIGMPAGGGFSDFLTGFGRNMGFPGATQSARTPSYNPNAAWTNPNIANGNYWNNSNTNSFRSNTQGSFWRPQPRAN